MPETVVPGLSVARAFGDQLDWTKITTHLGHDSFVELCSNFVELCSRFIEFCSQRIEVCHETFGNGGQIYVPETVVPGLSVARAFGDQVSELYTFPSPDVRLQTNMHLADSSKKIQRYVSDLNSNA